MNRFGTRSRNRGLVIAGAVLLFVFLATPVVSAFEGREGDVVIIGADEVIDDDLYVGAGQFTLDGTVKGDLIVGGGTIEINGTVEGDLWAAGQTIIVNGTVQDDVRIAGYSLIVDGQVADDLIALGFSLENKNTSSVGGDLFFAGYQTLLAGNVAGKAIANGNGVQIAGDIGGDATVNVGEAAPGEQMPPGFPFVPNLPTVRSIPSGLVVDEGAHIGGDLNYTANARADIPSGVVAGDTNFTEYVPEAGVEVKAEAPSPAVRLFHWFVGQVRRLITLLLVGVVMMWLTPIWTRKLASIVQTKPLPSLGWGFLIVLVFIPAILVLIVAFILLAILFGVTLGPPGEFILGLGGITVGATWLGFRLTWTYVTKIVMSLVLGQLIFRLFKSKAAEHRWWPMLLGVLIFFVVSAVPILVYLVVFVTGVFGLGAVLIWARERFRKREAEPVTVETEAVAVPPSQ